MTYDFILVTQDEDGEEYVFEPLNPITDYYHMEDCVVGIQKQGIHVLRIEKRNRLTGERIVVKEY